LMESKFDFRTFGFDTMLNYHLFQKLKLIGRNKFNHLIISLTMHGFVIPLYLYHIKNYYRF
jgi:hypothetical protein